jgi:hypothetical protein
MQSVKIWLFQQSFQLNVNVNIERIHFVQLNVNVNLERIHFCSVECQRQLKAHLHTRTFATNIRRSLKWKVRRWMFVTDFSLQWGDECSSRMFACGDAALERIQVSLRARRRSEYFDNRSTIFSVECQRQHRKNTFLFSWMSTSTST